MITMKDIKNAENPTAKAIEFVEWKAEIAENKILWKNPTRDPEQDDAAIRTFEKSANSLINNLCKNAVDADMNSVSNAVNSSIAYLRVIRLAKDAFEVRENCVKQSGSSKIVDFVIESNEVDATKEAEIIKKINECKEEAVWSVDYEANKLNETDNHYKMGDIMTVVYEFANGGFNIRTSDVDYRYSEKTLNAFIKAKTEYSAEVNTIYYEVVEIVSKRTSDHYEPRFNKYGKRIEQTEEATVVDIDPEVYILDEVPAKKVEDTVEVQEDDDKSAEYKAEVEAIVEREYNRAVKKIKKHSDKPAVIEAAITTFKNMDFPANIPISYVVCFGKKIVEYVDAMVKMYGHCVESCFEDAVNEGPWILSPDENVETKKRSKFLERVADYAIYIIDNYTDDKAGAMRVLQDVFVTNANIMKNEWKKRHIAITPAHMRQMNSIINIHRVKVEAFIVSNFYNM